MNLTLTRRGDYVVRSALALARAYPSGRPRKIREVVAEMAVPPTFASQILADLVRAELATSRAGKAGGYRLVRDPREISLLEVVEAGEGPLRAERCALGDGPCRWDAVCPLHETWSSATAAFRSSLAATSLADLAASDEGLETGTRSAPADSHRAGGHAVAVDQTVPVARPAAALLDRLHRLEPRMAAAVAAAYAEVLPAAGGWRPGEGDTAVVLAAEPKAATGTLTWECVSEAEDGESRFEGTVEVTPLGAGRSELRGHGHLRPPSHPGEAPDRLAESLLRAVLCHLAHLAGARAGSTTRSPAG